MPRQHAFLGDGRFQAIAHRGGNLKHPENTLEAFQDAVDLGYRYVETDVHPSLDGHLYAFHDPDLRRVTGLPAQIADLESSEIDTIRFDGDYRIPRLDELLSTWPGLRFNLDPKSDGAVEPLTRAIARHGAVDRVCVGSFSDRRIRYCRQRLGPALCTSMGPREIARLWLRGQGLPTGGFEAAAAQIPTSSSLFGLEVDVATTRVVEAAHEAGIAVQVWTINDRSTMNELIDLGVDGIMTDDLEELRSVLIARGAWEVHRVQ